MRWLIVVHTQVARHSNQISFTLESFCTNLKLNNMYIPREKCYYLVAVYYIVFVPVCVCVQFASTATAAAQAVSNQRNFDSPYLFFGFLYIVLAMRFACSLLYYFSFGFLWRR